MENYTIYTDIELQKLAVSGNDLAEEELVSRYARLVRACARPLFLAGGDSEDLTQEGMLGLLSAIREFDPVYNTSFKTYAQLCVKRRLFSAVKSASRMKHVPLNNGVSLDDILLDEISTYAGSTSEEAFRRIPEEQLLARESADEIFHKYSRSLSRFETDILKLYLEGLSYSEMAASLHRSQKSVDNAVQRIRRKLARNINHGEIS